MTATVIFDCDGVLVDSEPLAWKSWRQVLDRSGVEVTDGDVHRLTGRTAHETYTAFAAQATLPPFAEFIRDVSAILFGLFERNLQTFPDVRQTLSDLRAKDVRLGVASSSHRDRLDHALAVTGIARFFEVTVAGDEVESGKPNPELFIKAAALLGEEPGACTAVEDSPAGVESANRAGMRVVGVLRGSFTRAQLASAHQILESLDAASILSACPSSVTPPD